MIVARYILAGMRDTSNNSCSENKKKTHFMPNNFLFSPKIVPWKKHGRAGHATVDNTIRYIRFAYYTAKATVTHSEYVITIAIPLQQWLHERTSELRLYVHCLSCFHTEQSLCPHTTIVALSF